MGEVGIFTSVRPGGYSELALLHHDFIVGECINITSFSLARSSQTGDSYAVTPRPSDLIQARRRYVRFNVLLGRIMGHKGQRPR